MSDAICYEMTMADGHGTYLKYVISDVVNLNCRCISIAELRTQHALEARRCCDKYNFMAIKYFTLDSITRDTDTNTSRKKYDEQEGEKKKQGRVCVFFSVGFYYRLRFFLFIEIAFCSFHSVFVLVSVIWWVQER